MAKIHTFALTEFQLAILVGILIAVVEGARQRGRLDIAGPIQELLDALEPNPVTPVEV